MVFPLFPAAPPPPECFWPGLEFPSLWELRFRLVTSIKASPCSMSVSASGWGVVSPACIRLHSSDSSPDEPDSCGRLRSSVGVPGTFRKGEG